jgi:hypothetical protein
VTKVRISTTVANDLEGSQAWCDMDKPDSPEHPDDLSLMRKVREAPTRSDGSCTVELTDDELMALRDRADWLVDKSRDGVGSDPSALGDFNAGAALLRQIDKLLAGKKLS